jgi:hypothetical protein
MNMKKLVLITVVLMLVLSVGMAGAAGNAPIPKHIQDAYMAETGTMATFAEWFPIIPEQATMGWSNILILSNFNDASISVTCWWTSYSNEQTSKTYTLPFFGKKIVVLSQSGFGDDLYDVYCASNQLFGAAALLLENGNIAATWPPLLFVGQ